MLRTTTDALAASGDKDEQSDTSLRGKALDRALGTDIPKTLTPYEWEQWYAEHGVPESHRSSEPGHEPGPLRRLLQRLRNRGAAQ
ncbi:MAG: hypothetical protein R3228_13375 [Halioglobus sp.]|nr:hypothetical protein [Halioglobus sp.]